MKRYKITILGDIMSEPSLLQQAKTETGYDYHFVFQPLKGLLSEADYVIGNLETPFAGEEAGYTNSLVSFNTPDALAEAMKDAGLDMVTTANNHCLDRGFEGLERTLTTLDRIGLAHTGTYAKSGTKDRIHYFTLGNTTLAAISYTYGTNYAINGVAPDGEQENCINYLRHYNAPGMSAPLPETFLATRKLVEEFAGRTLNWEETLRLKLAMKVPVPYADDIFDPEDSAIYLEKVEADYREARNHADLVFFFPHIGGQFNTKPGRFSVYIIDWCRKLGFDGIFAAHSHTTQKAEIQNNVPCFYCLGNVSMSPCSIYSVAETLPQYGLAAHVYVENKQLVKTTFSILKIVEDTHTPLTVVPVDELYATLTDGTEKATLIAEVSAVYERVTGRKAGQNVICREYDL
ncbi:MAG TPA: CapA family protein [Clostridiaceae bacterium]|nr:CapA family protein [Clostridiaceae bacterium]